ncbi:MAG: hypothetical protein J5988_06530 [Eubacterium sp.]|nr:hypothetical protein [Eubacterium sp.]
MKGYFRYTIFFLLLFIGFALLFGRIRWLEMFTGMMQRTREGMDEAARKRMLENRKNLLALQRESSLWYRLEQELNYSGWKRRFPFLSAEKWLLGNLVIFTAAFLMLWVLLGLKGALIGCFALGGIELLALRICKSRESRLVNENLLKLLNFLGNYSITAGEVTSVFNQVSKYVDNPIKSALNECCYEAQTTGDAGMALLVMAEKIEHPKFKELAFNMEVSIRYCADFKALVDGSRRSVREYLRMREERKGILRDALINMLMLLAMSVFALLTVDQLIERSIWEILFTTIPGYVALGITTIIFVLLMRQLLRLNQ